MIDYLIKRNHTWENLIDGYSIGLVKNLFKAGRELDRNEHLQLVTGFSMAVANAIDLTFNKGKAKVLDTYYKAFEKSAEREAEEQPEHKGPKVSKSVMALFGSLPKKEEVTQDGS